MKQATEKYLFYFHDKTFAHSNKIALFYILIH